MKAGIEASIQARFDVAMIGTKELSSNVARLAASNNAFSAGVVEKPPPTKAPTLTNATYDGFQHKRPISRERSS
jgi:hypothetical protein